MTRTSRKSAALDPNHSHFILVDNPEHKAAKPHFIGGVDRIIYGKPTAAPNPYWRRTPDEINSKPASFNRWAVEPQYKKI